MKTLISLFALLCATFVSPSPLQAATQTSAFSYQGRMAINGTPANGSYVLNFNLFDASTGGNQVGPTLQNITGLADGLFTADLDFGDVYQGQQLWLQVDYAGTVIGARQRVDAVPAAQFARHSATGAYPLIAQNVIPGTAATTLTTAGDFSYRFACTIDTNNGVTARLYLSSPIHGYSLVGLVQSRVNDTGALAATHFDYSNLTNSNILTAVAGNGNVFRFYASPLFVVDGERTQQFSFSISADANGTTGHTRHCEIVGSVTASN